MDSSILELQEALNVLTDFNQHWGFESNGADAPGFARAYQVSRGLSEKFNGVNSSLEEGWMTTAGLFFSMFNLVSQTFEEMYKDIELFTDETYQAELQARDAVDKANEAANQILEELGISQYTDGTNTTVPSTTN